ncbi:hypothetical protein E2320_000980, partial [Naja naja]
FPRRFSGRRRRTRGWDHKVTAGMSGLLWSDVSQR